MNDSSPVSPQSNATGSGESDIREQLAIFVDEWLWIVGIVLAALLAAGLYVFAATPIYGTNALIQVEEKNHGLGALGDLSAVLAG
ncbi:MAG: Wzz/FepE/Etk N-terminal domain-containing protein, partial [Gammaproteobacteria bacterium]|nr:Wzz/FepE/Etk N-terminal domain-containing protein [Gammaproteobacteria bacterium]